MTRLGRTVDLVRELELTVIIMAVGEVGAPAVRRVVRVLRDERVTSVMTRAVSVPYLWKYEDAEQQTAQLS